MRKVVVLGASENVYRYSYQAIQRFISEGFDVYPVGLRKGRIGNLEIITKAKYISGVDTVVLYLNSTNQEKYYDYIFELNPQRIIFNPGAENSTLAEMASTRGITVINECTLVLMDLEEF